jgi:hypothetical protein
VPDPGVFCPTVIEEANWLTLPDDICDILGDGFDAVICLGNSFSHMPDTTGDRQDQRYILIFTLQHQVAFLMTVMVIIALIC